MAKLTDISEYLNEFLKTDSINDYSGAHNGIQLQNNGQVQAVVAAVDASEPVIKKAVDAGADLLIVHHGMFWHGVQKVTGAFYRKLKLAMDHNLAIYSSHLPLDVHPSVGNNVLLANALGLTNLTPFGDYKGISLGVKQKVENSFIEILDRAKTLLGQDVHHCAGGRDAAGTVGVVTGGAGSEVQKMADLGIDTFITGEGPHWSYSLAEELGINMIYGGHYATEVFGVKALSSKISDQFSIRNLTFIDHPTGL